MFIDLFQEIEVENLFKALDLCMEYVRLDLHVFNVGAHVTCSYSNDLESLSQAEGCNVNMIIIEERIKAGYYSAENIEKRREEDHKAEMLKKRAEICERYDKIIRQAEAEKKIMLCVSDYGLSTDNVIYYSHTNTLSFNWDSYKEKITQEEFDDFVNKVDRSQLPEDIRFELK